MLLIKSTETRVYKLAYSWFLSKHFDLQAYILELDPSLTIPMEKFIAQSFNLLNIASINQDSGKGPTYLFSCATQQQRNTGNGIWKDIATWMFKHHREENVFS